MKASKIAVAILVASAATAAFAADESTQYTDSGKTWFQAGTRQLQSEEQAQKLDSEGFQQYAD
jgi:hypothetical protein